MDVSWFRDLAYLARTGNFSHAAELSQVSQSALSRRVQTLERWVGVPLVYRLRQPVRLTEAGLQMLAAGQQALPRLETERSQIREAQSLPDKYVVTFGA
ncbi:MAG: LysR family transcriptional regulator, partial [Pseudomonadota bacterium]